MTTQLINRIQRLERVQHLQPSTCPQCGTGAPKQFDGEHFRQLRVIFDGDGDETPTHCPACGRQQVFDLEFDSPGDDEIARTH